MLRRSFRVGLWLGLLAGIGFAAAKIFRPKPEASSIPQAWPPLDNARTVPTPIPVPEPEPAPVAKPVAKKPAKKAAAPKKKLPPWVDPEGRVCPQTHPVKGKLSSMIFQVPGNFAYERTTPDRCYNSADDAEDDGLRAAKR